MKRPVFKKLIIIIKVYLYGWLQLWKKNLREQNLYKPLFDETMKIVVKIVYSGNNGFF